MHVAKNIVLLIHVASVIAILTLLLIQAPKSEKHLPKGVVHASLTALVAGLALLGIDSSLNDQVSHTKIGIKFIFLIIILLLAYANQKKNKLSNATWAIMLSLTIANFLIAIFA